MTPTTTEHPFLGAVTGPTGTTTIRFEGCEPRRTTKAQHFLVGFIHEVTRKYHAGKREYIPCLPQIVLVKGTQHLAVAQKAKQKAGRGAFMLRKTATGYEVV